MPSTLAPMQSWHQAGTASLLHQQALPAEAETWQALNGTCAGCRVRIDWKFVPTCKEGEVMTDMPFASYAPDLYEVRAPQHAGPAGSSARAALLCGPLQQLPEGHSSLKS